METFLYLIPISVILGLIGLVVFLWTLRNGQYDDLDGSAERIIYDEDRPKVEDAGQAEAETTFHPLTSPGEDPGPTDSAARVARPVENRGGEKRGAGEEQAGNKAPISPKNAPNSGNTP